MSEALIDVHHVGKIFGSGEAAVPALSDIDLSIYAGELTLMMGPSGSGKTTLLSIMGCIMSPTTGEVKIGGRAVSGLSEKEMARLRLDNISFIFQAYNLFSTLRVWENVAVAPALRGVPGSEGKRRAEAALAAVGLADKTQVFPDELSGGQKQRVAVARALAGAHRILLADEPTAALDSKSGRSVLDLLRRLAREENQAVVVVTHDARLLPFADRIVYMEDGRIVRDARPTGMSQESASHD